MGVSVAHLENAVKAVCPIYGISIGQRDVSGTWKIHFHESATPEQKTAANQILVSVASVDVVSDSRGDSKNWIRNNHWHYVSPGAETFSTTNGAGTPVANPANTLWWHGPGAGGATSGEFLQAIQGQWEGNPERFLRLTWNTAPTEGEDQYKPGFRFSFLEHWINTARILAGKRVTLSWQLRCVGGCPIIPIIWRAMPNKPVVIYSGPTFNINGDAIQRIDFTITLPAIPAGTDVASASYLGVGLDIPGQYGPVIDIGPSRLNEGGPQPFDETPYWLEKLMATQPYP